MPRAPIPDDEKDRLQALGRYEILDSEPEAAFDRLTALAARLLDVPIALVSLVDEHRQWFKSRVGLDVGETPRNLAFCAHAILEDRPLVVADATRDMRFTDNALVTGEPLIRAYAGVPLKAPGGHRLGTLCAIDRRPRTFSTEQIQILRELSAIAVDALELRLERRRALAAIEDTRRATEELRVLFDQAPLALWTLDAQGVVLSWNAAAEQVFGWTAGEAVGRFLPIVGPEQHEQFEQFAHALKQSGAPGVVDRKRQRKDGSFVDVRLAVAPLLDQSGGTRGFLTIAQDVTEELRLREELKRAASSDPMTGLFNRRGFEELAGRELARARRERTPVSMVMFDIDNFKQINDANGHPVGDRVLCAVSRIVRESLRATDVGSRWGGEELLVLLPNADDKAARAMAERARVAVAAHREPGLIACTISGGIAQWQDGEDLHATVARADERMYRAKALGRNRIC
jgi:diguanylate cyclase (GGDEF)-like protein/PAS domain S-box-containing protein